MGIWERFNAFVLECKRVLTVTKKPTGPEFSSVCKITGLGLLLIGLLGFLVQMVQQLLFK
jgi:protein transport protein SEC61 subunit gamma and related proteins